MGLDEAWEAPREGRIYGQTGVLRKLTKMKLGMSRKGDAGNADSFARSGRSAAAEHSTKQEFGFLCWLKQRFMSVLVLLL